MSYTHNKVNTGSDTVDQYVFELPFKVRDYECDLQGVVNNGVYQNYLEHTRHEYLKEIDLDFAQMHEEGQDAFVVRIEIDYKTALRSGDEFVVKLRPDREGRIKFVFYQDIYRLPDNVLVAKGKVTAAVMENGRPVAPQKMVDVFTKN